VRHIYVHVPFCRRRCSYCDFSIAVRKKIPAQRFVSAVVRERELRLEQGDWDNAPLETLYLGGGTPSLLPPTETARLLEIFGVAPGSGHGGYALRQPEITLEANPDDVSPAAAAAWARAGVSRVSLGVQSFNATVLEWMHRTHTAGQSVHAVHILRRFGIRSVSLDLIFALPAQLPSAFSSDLERALDLQPDHLSVYGLTVEPRTPLERWVSRGTAAPASAEVWAAEFLLAHRVLTAAGYEHYEVSNYARQDHRAAHNRAYWTGASYAGLGPAAHRFDGTTRRWNVAGWAEYDRLMEGRRDPTCGQETLTSEQRRLERTYLALRTSDGVRLEEACGLNRAVLGRAVAFGWIEQWATVSGCSRVSLTAEGWLRLDEIAAALTT
jgi:oxygen-independent coproporphyrinogen-3 oxidase